MGRKNIVSERIMEILDGNLLRFTAVHDEYKKRYKKVAFKQIADNLKLLQHKGIVSYFFGHYYLTDDMATGKFEEEKIELARESVDTYIQRMEDIVKTLETINYLLDVGHLIEIPFHMVWDKKRIRKLIVTQQEQLERLMKILEEDRV